MIGQLAARLSGPGPGWEAATPIMDAAAQSPTPLWADVVLGYVLFLVGGAVAVLYVSSSSVVGIYLRFLRVLVAVCLAMAPVILAVAAFERWPVALSEGCGLLVGTAWAGRRVHRRRSRPKPAVSKGFRPFDYILGVTLYLAFTFGLAQAAAQAPDTDLATTAAFLAGMFLTSQLTISALFRIFNRVLEHDYAMDRGWHYGLAAFP